jgi:predicted metal-dependent peptidase
MSQKLIDEVISFMAFNDPFNFTFLMKMNKSASTSVPTMGVHVKDCKIYLSYNLEFMGLLTKPELRYVLAHEVGHVALHHCTGRSSHDPKRHRLENIAQDLAINSLLPDSAEIRIPRHKADVFDEDGKLLAKKDSKMGMFPADFGFPEQLSFEQYLALLEEEFKDKDAPGQGEPGAGDFSGGFDSHDGFAADAEVDALIRSVVDRIERGQKWGNTPGKMQEAIKKAQITEVPWWQWARRFLGDFISMEKEQTRRKPHRRMGYPFFGETNEYVGEAHCFADTSASVGAEELGRFAGEVERLSDYMPVYLWMFDTAVQHPEKRPKPFHNARIKDIKFEGRGGTNFQAAIDHAAKVHARYVIIMSDGECSKPVVPAGMSILWVITPGHDGDLDGWPGKVVYMKKHAA